MRLYILFVIFICNFKVFSQSSNSFTSFENNQNINIQNKTTNINLFDIEIDGVSFPITLQYNHSGIKVNDVGTSLGLGWKLLNLGEINTIVNDENDSAVNTGWFNSINPSNTTYTFISGNQSAEYLNGNHGSLGVDMSPDFYNLNILNGINFTFLFNKNLNGNVIQEPIPFSFNGTDGCKIITNFNNFYVNQQVNNSNKVFTIIDKKGTNYEFINGPNLNDVNRSSYSNRNNFYLQKVTNIDTNKSLIIDYYTEIKSYRKFSYVGYTNEFVTANLNKILNVTTDYYFKDLSENRIKSILTSSNYIEFVYDGPGSMLLNEINIYDLNNNFITGYLFEYLNNQMGGNLEFGIDEFYDYNLNLLTTIKKYNSQKTDTITLYSFEYFDGDDFFSFNDKNSDVFGYYNGINDNQSPFPLISKNNNSSYFINSANRLPNLNFAKQYCLKKVTNKYGGTKEFDYKLNLEHFNQEDYYGGGLLIESITENPIIGKALFKKYNYSSIKGFVCNLNSLKEHFSFLPESGKYFYSSQFHPEQFVLEQEDSILDLERNVIGGNYFKTIQETNSENNTSNDFNIIFYEYGRIDNGLFVKPILTKKTELSAISLFVKKIEEFIYDEYLLPTFEFYKFRKESRQLGTSSFLKFEQKKKYHFVPHVKRLIKTIEIENDESGIFTKIKNYEYINNNNCFLRKEYETNSLGELKELFYYYPEDSQMNNEPNVTNLNSLNKIGLPILKKSFLNNNLLFEEKTVFSSFISQTSQPFYLPDNKLIKKGNNNFESRINFKYNTDGKLVEVVKDNNKNTVYVWGYNNSKIIAIIENVNYNSIASLIPNLQSISNSGTEAQLISALNAFRNNVNLINSHITTYTYNKNLKISTLQDLNNKSNYYLYDDYDRLQFIKDNNGNIIYENETKFQFEN